MNPLFRIPIRLQLIIIVAIVALPAAGIIIDSGFRQRNHAINHARRDTQILVERVASEQRILVDSIRQLVVSLAELPEVKEKDAAKTNLFLKKILKLHSNFTGIVIADRTGAIWASAEPFTSPISNYGRRHFKNALASGQLSSGEFQLGLVSHKANLDMGYPYKNNHGDIIGVITVGIDLQYYRTILQRTQLPNRANMILVDHKGVILFRAIDPENYIGNFSNPILFKRMFEGPDANTSIEVGVAGDPQERYVSYQKLRLEGESSPYMYVRVGIPVKSVLSQVKTHIIKNLSLFTFVLALALFLSWFVGKRSIVDRITLLKITSRSIADGNLQVRVSDLVKGGELGELGESLDIMAQQLAAREESLSDSQRFLNTIIDTEPECVKLLDADGRVQMMNPAGLKLIDAESFEQVKGQSIYPLITTEYRDAFVKHASNVFEGLSGNIEFEAVGFKGRRVWLDSHAVPFRNDIGEIVSLLGITRDITDRKLAEKSLIEKQHQLEDINMYLEKRIEDAVTDSRKKDQILIQQGRQAAMGEMISNIAHQWRQPLNTLALIVQELRMTYGRVEFTQESLDANVNKAMGLINNMSKTIDYFRNFFKPSKKKCVFKVIQVVDKILKLIEPSLKNMNIDIVVGTSKDAEISEIDGYENEYSQVLLNIIINSKDSFETRNLDMQKVITITVYKEDNKSVVTIADNAGGIPEDIIDKVFDPYFTTKGPDKGTGIGLYMAKTIIEKNMGGKLTVRNTDDGAEFRIEV